MRRRNVVLLGVVVGFSLATLTSAPRYDGELQNYGVKGRSHIGSITSSLADGVMSRRGYNQVAELVPYVKECEEVFGIPANVLLAILYEEAVHRKPVDLQTFGVAQIGVGELLAQGLPPDPALLENDEFSVWMLARKLKRLQAKTGSLQTAIILHNGFSDYLTSVQARAKDPMIRMLLEQENFVPTYET